MYADKPLKEYLQDLGSKLPAPGGGSAAALAGALAAASVEKVANFTVGKTKSAEEEKKVADLLSLAKELRIKLVELIDEDVKAYNKVARALKMPRESSEEKKARSLALEAALKESASVPLEVCKCSHEGLKLCSQLSEFGNPNLISDVAVALTLFDSAFTSGKLNVEVNLEWIKEEEFVVEIRQVLEPLEKETKALVEKGAQEVQERMARAKIGG